MLQARFRYSVARSVVPTTYVRGGYQGGQRPQFERGFPQLQGKKGGPPSIARDPYLVAFNLCDAHSYRRNDHLFAIGPLFHVVAGVTGDAFAAKAKAPKRFCSLPTLTRGNCPHLGHLPISVQVILRSLLHGYSNLGIARGSISGLTS